MATLGNLIWFFTGGFALFLAYGLGAILFFPAFIPLFRMAVYAAWPFGRGVVTQSQLQQYKEATGRGNEVSTAKAMLTNLSGIANLLWLFTFGIGIAFVHFIGMMINLALFWTIVAIPNIVGHWRMIRVALMPFNKVIVPKGLEKEIEEGIAKGKLGL